MSYRKLELDGTIFEYSIGKTHTKIRHVGAFKNEDVGKKYTHGYTPCGCSDCTCEPYEFYDVLEVRPNDIANFIRKNKLKLKEKK